MDPELKRTLDEIHALAKDNHKMLRAIRRDQWLGLIGKIIVWAIVLALPLFLYQHYFQPIISGFSETASTTPTGFFGFPTSAEAQKLVNFFKVGH